MKRMLTFAVLALCLAGCSPGLSGCTSNPILNPSQGLGTQTTLDEQALYVAEAARYGLEVAAKEARLTTPPLLVPGSENAIKVADKLRDANTAILLARRAYAAGDARSYADKLREFQGLAGQTWALLPKTPA